MDLNDVRSLVTLFSFLLFVALAFWTWRPARQRAHEAAAALPFLGEVTDEELAAAMLARNGRVTRTGSEQ